MPPDREHNDPSGMRDDGWTTMLRRAVQLAAVGALLVTAAGMVSNALTVHDRALATYDRLDHPEVMHAGDVAVGSWIAAVACVGVLAILVFGRRRFRAETLWSLGLLSVVAAFAVSMWTATVWV